MPKKKKKVLNNILLILMCFSRHVSDRPFRSHVYPSLHKNISVTVKILN